MRRRRRLGVRRGLVGLIAIAWVIGGLLGAYSYGQDYYQHRGFATLVQLPRAGTGRLENVDFYSQALHRRADYLAYLPPGYDRAHRYPVYYLLHGMPGQPRVFIGIANMDVRLDNLLSQHRLAPLILVFPDGRIGGSVLSDSEWANTPSGGYESYVIEVMKDVDQRFAALPERQARVIGGFSAGAYGALNIALHHPGDFGSVQVWSGYFSAARSGVFAGANEATLHYNSPIDYVTRRRTQLAAEPLRVFMFVGRGDESKRQIVPMTRVLRQAGASVRYAVYRGGHDWQLWHAHLNQMLILASLDASQPLPRAGGIAVAAGVGPGTRATHHGQAARRSRRSRQSGRSRRARQSGRSRRAHQSGRSRQSHQPGRSRQSHQPGRSRRSRRSRPHARPVRAGAAHRSRRPGRAVGQAVAAAAGRSRPRGRAVGQAAAAHPRRHVAHRRRRLIGALLLALASAATINLGFLFQHRGLATHASGWRGLPTAMLRNRAWLGGQALGWIGFGAQVLAVAIAPLALVQAFAAGGLAISVPVAAGIFGYRISRDQVLAVLLIAACLFSLPLALSPQRTHLHADGLMWSSLLALLAAAAIGLPGRTSRRAIAAGIFYGVADAAIKADSVNVHSHGIAALFSGWTVLAIVATFGGFAAFQAALRADSAVTSISLMSAFAALVALGCGVFAFGESLGRTPAATIGHLLAISIVLACVPVLARAQQEMASVNTAAAKEGGRGEPLRPGYGTG